MASVFAVRRFLNADVPVLWALNARDTATNQPEAMAFNQGLGYREVGRERQPDSTWTLVYYLKELVV